MKHGSNQRRGRSRGNGNKRHQSSRNHTLDSNGPEGKVRGTAQQIHDKYLSLARDATASGEHITAEGFYQFAEHYYRLVNADGANNQNRNRQPQNEQPTADQQQGDEQQNLSNESENVDEEKTETRRASKKPKQDAEAAVTAVDLSADNKADNPTDEDVKEPEQIEVLGAEESESSDDSELAVSA